MGPVRGGLRGTIRMVRVVRDSLISLEGISAVECAVLEDWQEACGYVIRVVGLLELRMGDSAWSLWYKPLDLVQWCFHTRAYCYSILDTCAMVSDVSIKTAETMNRQVCSTVLCDSGLASPSISISSPPCLPYIIVPQ